jgi:SNF2 family DNA or RNA helicase
VFIPKELRDVLKPHQIEGIQFVWKNMVTLSRTGCILAHSMGLGKTLQMIAFLLSYFRHSGPRTTGLIICPTTVAHNWSKEFKKWLNAETWKELKILPVMDRTLKTSSDRMHLLKIWMEQGGVLIIGYSMYRHILLEVLRNVPFGLLGQEVVYRALMNPGPSVVICDEGHIIKNQNSVISRLLKMIKTYRRICLTGYPLQNNLMEYWCMVRFESIRVREKTKESYLTKKFFFVVSRLILFVQDFWEI